MIATERLCRSSMYADAGMVQHHGDREVRCGKPHGHAGSHAEYDQDGAEIAAWLPAPGPSVSGQPTPEPGFEILEDRTVIGNEAWVFKCTACGQISSRYLDPIKADSGAWEHLRRMHGLEDRTQPLPDSATVRAQLASLTAENARLRSQLAEAREQRDEALSALRRIADKLDIAQSAPPALVADLTVRYVDGTAANLGAALERAEAAHERLSTLSGIADGERELRAAQLERERDSLREEHTRLVAEVRKFADEAGEGGRFMVALAIRDRLRRMIAFEPAAAPVEAQSNFQPPNLDLAADGSSQAPAAPGQPEERDDEDWTAHDGRSNTSWLFLDLANEVARLIRDDAFQLLRGRADRTAGLIVAQLAHKHGMVPAAVIADVRAALATAEQERDEARQEHHTVIGAVARAIRLMPDDPDAWIPGMSEVLGQARRVVTERDEARQVAKRLRGRVEDLIAQCEADAEAHAKDQANGIRATGWAEAHRVCASRLRAALGSTPDTGEA